MIRRVLVQSDAHKAPQRQRVRQPPGNPALRPDALEMPDQQRPKVNPRRQRRTPVLGRIELRTPLLDKLVEALGLQQLIQTLIKRMPWSRRQLGVRDPDLLLLLPLLARPHRHAPILQTNSVDTVKVLAYEPGLAPRAVRLNFDDSTPVHTPAAMAELLKQMEPFVTGAGSFEIETSGERWTEYVGSREEV